MPKDLFESKYSELLKEHEANGLAVLQAHCGEMGTEEDVNSLAYELETKLKEEGVKKGIVKRIFSLLVEALQNIRLHGAKDVNDEQFSYYIFAKDNDEFKITTANLILNENIERVQPKIDKINSLDRAGLKEYYMETLTDGQRSVKGGAGLGFITVAMKAKNKLNYELIKIDDRLSFFQMQTNIVTKKEEE